MGAVTGDLAGASSPVRDVSRGRLDWLDAARGIGIILVVAGHAIGGILSSSLPGKTAILPYADAGIYTFHMDLFFFLSGLTIAARIEKGPDVFLKRNFTKIAYAYAIWSIVQYNVIYFAAGNMANSPIHDYNLMLLLTGNISQFWFLYVLFFYNLASRFLLRPLGPVAMLLLALAARPFSALFAAGDTIGAALHFALPYMAGVALGADRLDGPLRHLEKWHVVALMLFALVDEALILSPRFGGMPGGLDGHGIIDFVYSVQALPSSILLSAAVIGLAAIATGPVARHLAYLGRMSLPIYILHIMCIAGTRIFLAKVLHVSNIWLILAIIVPCGLAVPLVAVTLLDRIRLARPLGLL